MAWAHVAVRGTGSLVFIDEMTADRSSKINSEVERATCSHSAKCYRTGQHFKEQVDNDTLQKQVMAF